MGRWRIFALGEVWGDVLAQVGRDTLRWGLGFITVGFSCQKLVQVGQSSGHAHTALNANSAHPKGERVGAMDFTQTQKGDHNSQGLNMFYLDRRGRVRAPLE